MRILFRDSDDNTKVLLNTQCIQYCPEKCTIILWEVGETISTWESKPHDISQDTYNMILQELLINGYYDLSDYSFTFR